MQRRYNDNGRNLRQHQRNIADEIGRLQSYNDNGHPPYQFDYAISSNHQYSAWNMMHLADIVYRQNYENAMYQRQYVEHAMLKAHFQGYRHDDPALRYRSAQDAHHLHRNWNAALAARDQRVDHQASSYSRQSSCMNDYSSATAARKTDGIDVNGGDDGLSTNDCSSSGDDERPRPTWTHKENPTWQPPLESRTGEYSGTELIQARAEDALAISYGGLSNFHDNIRAQPWQLASALNHRAQIVARNLPTACAPDGLTR